MIRNGEMHLFLKRIFFGFSLGFALMQASVSGAASSTVIDNASVEDRAVITFPDYSVSPPGKWTIVVVDQKKLRFRSMDGTQNMQAGTLDLHPKSGQSEADAFRSYVDTRRQLEQENIENKALKSDAVDFGSNDQGALASWCIIDPAGASGHLTAILENKRKLLVVSYDAEKVTEADFRKRADMVVRSMHLK
jgi:hypothetical protein